MRVNSQNARIFRELSDFHPLYFLDSQPVGIQFLWKLLSYKSAWGTVFRVNQFSQWFLLRAENSQPVVIRPPLPSTRPEISFRLFLGLSMLLWFMPVPGHANFFRCRSPTSRPLGVIVPLDRSPYGHEECQLSYFRVCLSILLSFFCSFIFIDK